MPIRILFPAQFLWPPIMNVNDLFQNSSGPSSPSTRNHAHRELSQDNMTERYANYRYWEAEFFDTLQFLAFAACAPRELSACVPSH